MKYPFDMNKPRYEVGDIFFICGACETNLIEDIFNEDKKHLAFRCDNCQLVYVIRRNQDFVKLNYIFPND